MSVAGNTSILGESSLVIPKSAGGLVIGIRRRILNEVEQKAGCEISVQNLDGGRKLSLSLHGYETAVSKGHGLLLELLSKSKDLQSYTCEGDVAESVMSWDESTLLRFQKENQAIIDFDELGDVHLKAWTNDELEAAKTELLRSCSTANNSFCNSLHGVFGGTSKYPDHLNVLVLGETGVGKSTFINGLVNYLKYETLDEAKRKGVEILIKSSFTMTDNDLESHLIEMDPTVENEQQTRENELFEAGQSATQDPKSYVFSWEDNGVDKSIRIIDTPGIGDTRGIEQDKENFEKILKFISEFSELHAICVLLKPNAARLTVAFRFCIDELLVHLHKSASDNILFCFTNTRGTLYKPGDTLPTLRQHLANLEQKRGIRIPLDKATMFSFDNESFRFLCATQKGHQYSQVEHENFSASWNHSVEESYRLFSRVAELPVHSVNDTLSLNNTRSIILAMTRPLAEISRNQMVNRALIEDKLKEIEAGKRDEVELTDQLYVNQVVMRTEAISHPRTVCTAASCVDHKAFSAEPGAPLQTVYKQICHSHCYLNGVQEETCPNTILQNCWAMKKDRDGNIVCHQCYCLWTTHMHIRYQLKEDLKKIVDPVVEQSILRQDSAIKTKTLFVESLKERAEEMKAESDQIRNSCAEFAAFLDKNSIMPYNDSYRRYVEHMIKEEKEKVAAGGPKKWLKELERCKQEYEEQVTLLETGCKAATTSISVRTIEDVQAMLKSLHRLKHCGTLLRDVEKLQMLCVQQTQGQTGQVIKINQKSRKRNVKGEIV